MKPDKETKDDKKRDKNKNDDKKKSRKDSNPFKNALASVKK